MADAAAVVEAPPSSCLRLRLAELLGGRVGVQAALAIANLRQELESYGDIAQVGHLRGSGPSDAAMLVTFWDRRSARRAEEAFGSACSYEPQATWENGSCSATLTQDSLGQFQDCQIAKTTELGDGLLEVEFFDPRAAAAAIAMSATCSTLASLTKVGSGCDLDSTESASDCDQDSTASESRQGPPPAAAGAQAAAARWEPMYLPTGEGPGTAQEAAAGGPAAAPTASDAQAPERACGAAGLQPKFLRGEDGLGLSQLSWGALERRQEWRTELRLRGLPPSMCERRALQEVIVQLGLQDAVGSVRVPDAAKNRAGCALLRARSVADVPRIAKAFHGRVFRGSRSPVAVSFSDGSGLRLAAPAGRLGLPEPRRVSCAAAAAEAEEELARCAAAVAGAGGLAFPPGLPRPAC